LSSKISEAYLEKVHSNIKKRMKAVGLNQITLAQELGMKSNQRITNLMKGRARWEQTEVSQLLIVLECSHADIFPIDFDENA